MRFFALIADTRLWLGLRRTLYLRGAGVFGTFLWLAGGTGRVYFAWLGGSRWIAFGTGLCFRAGRQWFGTLPAIARLLRTLTWLTLSFLALRTTILLPALLPQGVQRLLRQRNVDVEPVDFDGAVVVLVGHLLQLLIGGVESSLLRTAVRFVDLAHLRQEAVED